MIRGITTVIFLLLVLSGCSTPEPEIIDTGQPGNIKLIVFQDLNTNNTQDPGEPGVSDLVALTICRKPGEPAKYVQPEDVVRTDQEGAYLFRELSPDKYCVIYMGSSSTTTKLEYTVYLDSGESAEVGFGLYP